MRRLIAHIGANKTGTTAFQTWLQANRAALLDAGYLVPSEGATGNNGGLVRSFYEPDRRGRKAEQFLADAETYRACDILLSAERLGRVGGDDLRRMATRFDAIVDRRIAVLVVRDPIANYNSGYAQRGKSARIERPPFPTFVAEQLAAGRAVWRRRIEEYEASGFEVRVLPYDAAFRAKGSPRAIIELPDFGVLAQRFDWSTVPDHNPSMGAIGLILMDLVTARDDRNGRKRSPAALRRRVIEIAAERFDDAPFNGFTAALRRHLLDALAEGNAWTAERFFDAPWDDLLPPQSDRPVSPRSVADLDGPQREAVIAAAAEIASEARRNEWL